MALTTYTNTSAIYIAGLIRTALAGGKVLLWKSIAQPLSSSTVIADFTEADFSSYSMKTVANFGLPYLDPEFAGASIQSGTLQWDWATLDPDPDASNSVKGFYLTNAAGALVMAAEFDDDVIMSQPGHSCIVNVILNYGS